MRLSYTILLLERCLDQINRPCTIKISPIISSSGECRYSKVSFHRMKVNLQRLRARPLSTSGQLQQSAFKRYLLAFNTTAADRSNRQQCDKTAPFSILPALQRLFPQNTKDRNPAARPHSGLSTTSAPAQHINWSPFCGSDGHLLPYSAGRVDRRTRLQRTYLPYTKRLDSSIQNCRYTLAPGLQMD